MASPTVCARDRSPLHARGSADSPLTTTDLTVVGVGIVARSAKSSEPGELRRSSSEATIRGRRDDCIIGSAASICSLSKIEEFSKLKQHRIRRLFDWLSKQSWAEEYYSDDSGIKVGIEKISKELARRQMLEADFGDVVMWCTFSEPTPGRFVQTADQENQPMAPRDPLRPGKVINTSARCGIYSGSVGAGGPSLPAAGIGMSVGHLFNPADDGNIYTSTEIGSLKHRVDEIFLEPNEECRTTADLSFITINDSVYLTCNEVDIDGVTYSLKLYKGELRVGMNVLVIDQSLHVRHGKIKTTDYSRRSNNLHNTLSITDSTVQATDQKITRDGDSGSLVLYRGLPIGGNIMYVLGISIGVWDHDDPPTNRGLTIANRLREILLAIGKNQGHCQALTGTRLP